MKRFLIVLLIISVGTNIIFFQRKMKRAERFEDVLKLHHYKKIPYEKGYICFQNAIEENYPGTTLRNKYIIVYRWDSLHYDFIHREQMKALDSMAANFGKYKLEYVFVTEMAEEASRTFLKENYDEYKNVKMLYGMDDYISGLYNNKDIKLVKPTVIHRNPSKKVKENEDQYKQSSLYVIMDSEGRVLFTNGNKFMVLKDSSFLNKLKAFVPATHLKILN